MKARAALVQLFAPRRPSVLDDLAGRSDTAMRVLFDTVDAGLLLVDAGGRVVRANPALRAMLAADVDLSEGAATALIFAPDERLAVWRGIEALLANRRPRCRMTARLRLADAGPHHLVDIACRLVVEPDDSVSGLLMRLTDITAQARLEAQLAQSQGLQAVGHLAGGVAHDFNNLLTTILGAVELAQERGLDPQTSADLEQIRRSAERGAALVRNLLALGRQQYLQARPLDVNTALEDVAGLLRRAIGKGVELALELERPGRFVRVDPGQFDQVLMNLAMNARHAMRDGGTLTLRSGHATLYRTLVHGTESIPPGRYVTVAVRDTGCGIAPEIMKRIFEPFFTTRRSQGGSGLGLATAHGIVRQSGGFLTVESTPGAGSTFRIYLPRQDAAVEAIPPVAPTAPAAPAPAAAVAVAATAPSPGCRVLLVDDEQAVRRIAARALARQGWTVLEADSAEAALDLLDADPVLTLTALISDVVMPGRDGAFLVDAVRTRYPDLPAILVSGYADGGVLADHAAKGIAFLAKPYTPRTLLARLADLLPPDAADRPRRPEDRVALAATAGGTGPGRLG